MNIRRYIKAGDVAAEYGVAKKTVYEWKTQGVLPHYKIGRSIYFAREEVDEAMNRNRFVGEIRCPGF